MTTIIQLTISERFWSKVDKSGSDNACWIWTAHKNKKGYGYFGIGNTVQQSHRVSWELTYGEIPDGLCVLHNCPDGDNPSCVNPKHLFLGTNIDNVRDMDKKGRRAVGENAPNRKLTANQVRYIRKRHSEGDITFAELGRQMGVKGDTISDVVRRKFWKSID